MNDRERAVVQQIVDRLDGEVLDRWDLCPGAGFGCVIAYSGNRRMSVLIEATELPSNGEKP